MMEKHGLLFGLAALFVIGLILSRRAAASSASSPSATGRSDVGPVWTDYQ